MQETREEQIRKLQEAIETAEKTRQVLGDIVAETMIASLKKDLAALQPEQTRKLATILFLDTAGSTSITRGMDPEENMEFMEATLVRLQQPVEAAGGRITRYDQTGDGFKAIFGAPEAHEDDPKMAVRAALGIIETAKTLREELRRERGIQNFSVRIGIGTGLVLVGGFTELENSIKGDVVNLAARLEQAAPSNGILISEHTEKLVRNLFELEPVPPFQAKGFIEPVTAFRVLGVIEDSFLDPTRGAGVKTPLVGRDEQLAELQALFEGVRTAGKPHMRTVIAEAGVGKSRLMQEFRMGLKIPVHVFEGRAFRERQGTPYAVLKDLFSRYLGIHDNFPADRLTEKFDAQVAPVLGVEEDGKMRAHFIGQLLGFDFTGSPFLEGVVEDTQQLSDRAWRYLIEFFRNISADQPCLLCIEDIHWADEPSLNKLLQLIEQLEDRPVLLLCNSRPSLFELQPKWGTTSTSSTSMRLPPLSRLESSRLIGEILAEIGTIPLILREYILTGSEGNPYYIEELIKMLNEKSVIRREGDRWLIEQNMLIELEVPPTLTGVIQARLDSLPSFEKNLLQQASVIGRAFWEGILVEINAGDQVEGEQDLVTSSLEALEAKEMIVTEPHSAFTGTREFTFRHTILREVTYETVLKRMRPVYHGLVAEWMISHSLEDAGEFAPLIADHLEEAGQLERAAVFLKKAGEQSMKQYANEEALRYFDRALTLLQEDEINVRFQTLLARTQIYLRLGATSALTPDLYRLQELADRLDDDARRGEVALMQAMLASQVSDYTSIIRNARRAIEFGETANVPGPQGFGRLLWGRALIAKGDYVEAQEMLDKALQIARSAALSSLEAESLRYFGLTVEILDSADAASSCFESSLEISKKIGDLRGQAFALRDLGNLKLRQPGQYDQGVEAIRQFHSITQEIGDRLSAGYSFQNLAELSRRQGDFSAASEFLNKALSISTTTGNVTIELGSLLELGLIALEQYRFAEAAANFSQMLDLAIRIGNRRMEARALMEIGRLFHRQQDYVRALNYYQQAFDVFQAQSARTTPRVLGFIGLLYKEIRNPSQALQAVEEGLTVFGQSPFRPKDKAFLLTVQGLVEEAEGLNEEALSSFKEALLLFEDVEEANRRLDPLAGIGRALLKLDRLDEALKIAETIFETVAAAEERLKDQEEAVAFIPGLEGTTDPIAIYFTCGKTFSAGRDPRAGQVLDKLAAALKRQAARIEEIEQRQVYLNSTGHREILEYRDAAVQA